MSPGIQAENRLIGSVLLPLINSLPADTHIARPFTQAKRSHQAKDSFSILICVFSCQILKAFSF